MTDSDTVVTCAAEELPLDDPSPGDYVEVEGDIGVIEEILGGRARINYAVQERGPEARIEMYGTEELGNPSRGDIVRVDGEQGVVEEILGGRARVNLSVRN